MQIQLIVPSKGGPNTSKGSKYEHGFCPFVAHRVVEGNVNGVRYLSERLYFLLHVLSMNHKHD